MADIIIVGAGIAGLTAGIYSKRAGMDTVIFENNMYGGQIVTSQKVENYPGIKSTSGVSLALELHSQATELGATIISEKVLEIVNNDSNEPKARDYKWLVKTNKADYYANAVIIATGLVHRELDFDGAASFKGKGMSYCATCDGAFFKGKKVAVYGGGDTALTDAIFLAQYCEKVYVIHRRGEFRAQKYLVDAIDGYDNVVKIMSKTIQSIIGDDNGKVKGIVIEDKINEKEELEVEGLFVAIGQKPVNDYFKNLVHVNESGFIVAGEDCKTDVEGVFVAGDCRTKKVRQLTTAAADGTVAAIGAIEYITMREK